MRRIRVLVAAALALCAFGLPGHADAPQGGRVLLPSGSPAVAKAEFNDFHSNGVTGYVLPLSPSADGKNYSLTALLGATGAEDFDAWFYEDIAGPATGPGTICGTIDSEQNGPVETGRICPNAQHADWAVIVLFTGANGTFVFSY